jgi:hypothetical protein
MDLTGGDVETDTRANGNGLFAERRLTRSREKGDGLLDRMGVQQNSVSRLEPLLGDEESLRAIPRRDQVLGRQPAGTRHDRDVGVVDATTGRGCQSVRVTG